MSTLGLCSGSMKCFFMMKMGAMILGYLDAKIPRSGLTSIL